jgi:hypothetical protein
MIFPTIDINAIITSIQGYADPIVTAFMPAAVWIMGAFLGVFAILIIIKMFSWATDTILHHSRPDRSYSLHPYLEGMEYKGILRNKRTGSVLSGRRDTME